MIPINSMTLPIFCRKCTTGKNIDVKYGTWSGMEKVSLRTRQTQMMHHSIQNNTHIKSKHGTSVFCVVGAIQHEDGT